RARGSSPAAAPGCRRDEDTMRLRRAVGCAALLARLMVAPAAASAQADTAATVASGPIDEPPVQRYDYSGPRLGVTFAPHGNSRSQFGWHFRSEERRVGKEWR